MRRSTNIKILGTAGAALAAIYFISNQSCSTVSYQDYNQCIRYNAPHKCEPSLTGQWTAYVCPNSHYSHGGYFGSTSRGGFGRLGRLFSHIGS